jgi:HSP20 family protein
VLQRYDQNSSHPLARIQHEFNQMMNRFFPESMGSNGTFSPAFNIKEESQRFVIEGELPGMDLKDLNIEVHGNVLSIHGERRSESKKEGHQHHVIESQYGAFHRTFTIPEHVDLDKITAEHKRGMLYVYLPKDMGQRPRRIDVRDTERQDGNMHH